MTARLIELEREKQDLIFREEAIKVQLNNISYNLAEERDIDWRELRKRIDNIVNDHYI